MRILIASDLHGSLESALFLQEKSKTLSPDLCILLGDFLYHGPRNPLPLQYTPKDVTDVLASIMQIPVDILAVRGNCDAHVDEEVLPFELNDSVRLHVDGRNFIASHGHQYGRDPDFSHIQPGTIMLTGHTHVPITEERNNVIWWNPGSLSLPKFGYPRTYGLYENNVFKVYDIQDNLYLEYIL